MKRLLLACAACLLGTVSAYAIGGTMQFDGVVLAQCNIAISAPGVLDLSADGGSLTSKQGLGRPASAVIQTTGAGFRLDVSRPTAFTIAPPNANAGVSFSTSYNASGVSVAINVNGGTVTPLGIGLTNLNVDLVASRAGGFPSGIYAAQTTVTCE